MKLLTSEITPLITKHETFYKAFYRLIAQSESLKICTGFITADSIADILQLIKFNGKPKLNLAIGMHQFSGFEKSQYQAVQKLHSFLKHKGLGEVRVSTQFPYHGKIYEFLNDDSVFAAILGSSNLSSIVKTTNRIYESNLLLDEDCILRDLSQFTNDFYSICEPIDLIIPNLIVSPAPLQGVEGVEKADLGEYERYSNSARGPSFSIPLKSTMRSNLNVYFGKGRLNTRTGVIIPRPWYEVEIIVSNQITSKAGYPRKEIDNGVFTALTDDGWTFKCKSSGDYSKNLRSESSLSILGRWIKGRLEAAGALIPGEPVTDATLATYGKDNLDLIYTGHGDIWLLNFKP